MKSRKKYSFEELILTMELENVVGFLRCGAKTFAISAYSDAKEYYRENKEKLSKYSHQLNRLGRILGVKL